MKHRFVTSVTDLYLKLPQSCYTYVTYLLHICHICTYISVVDESSVFNVMYVLVLTDAVQSIDRSLHSYDRLHYIAIMIMSFCTMNFNEVTQRSQSSVSFKIIARTYACIDCNFSAV